MLGSYIKIRMYSTR